MTTTDWALSGFLLFIALWVAFIAWGLRQARKQVAKINAELEERDARWRELGNEQQWPGPHWPGPPP
jgi:hypothetical protein